MKHNKQLWAINMEKYSSIKREWFVGGYEISTRRKKKTTKKKKRKKKKKKENKHLLYFELVILNVTIKWKKKKKRNTIKDRQQIKWSINPGFKNVLKYSVV